MVKGVAWPGICSQMVLVPSGKDKIPSLSEAGSLVLKHLAGQVCAPAAAQAGSELARGRRAGVPCAASPCRGELLSVGHLPGLGLSLTLASSLRAWKVAEFFWCVPCYVGRRHGTDALGHGSTSPLVPLSARVTASRPALTCSVHSSALGPSLTSFLSGTLLIFFSQRCTTFSRRITSDSSGPAFDVLFPAVCLAQVR